MKKLACLFLSMGLAVGLTAAASAETVLRFATDSSEDYVSTVQIYKFADEVKDMLIWLSRSKTFSIEQSG